VHVLVAPMGADGWEILSSECWNLATKDGDLHFNLTNLVHHHAFATIFSNVKPYLEASP